MTCNEKNNHQAPSSLYSSLLKYYLEPLGKYISFHVVSYSVQLSTVFFVLYVNSVYLGSRYSILTVL